MFVLLVASALSYELPPVVFEQSSQLSAVLGRDDVIAVSARGLDAVVARLRELLGTES